MGFKTVCPYCFERFNRTRAPFRLTAAGCDQAPDEIVGEFLSVPAPQLGTVFGPDEPPTGMNQRICPRCHMSLPHAAAKGELDSKIIAVIGARNAGKSNFFGILLRTLEQRYSSKNEVDFSIMDQNSFCVNEMKPMPSWKLYDRRYRDRLFEMESRMAIEQNQSAIHDKFLRMPLIFRLRHNAFRQPMDLVFYEAAGEDLDKQEAIEQFNPYVLNAAGIVLLVDPLELPGVWNGLSESVRDHIGKVEARAGGVLARVIGALENRGLSARKKIKVPIAVALSKSDLLRPMLPTSSLLRRDGRHIGGFNHEECSRLSYEVRGWIEEWGGDQLLQQLDKNFKTSEFFALSALGALPDESFCVPRLAPTRIADPLLWLLWKLRAIPAAPRAGHRRAS